MLCILLPSALRISSLFCPFNFLDRSLLCHKGQVILQRTISPSPHLTRSHSPPRRNGLCCSQDHVRLSLPACRPAAPCSYLSGGWLVERQPLQMSRPRSTSYRPPGTHIQAIHKLTLHLYPLRPFCLSSPCPACLSPSPPLQPRPLWTPSETRRVRPKFGERSCRISQE